MNPLAPVLTIDGPSGAGKGTISRIIARRMGWHYLDSGALYRAVGVAASWADIDTSDASALVRCTFDTHVQFVEQGEAMRVMVNGTDATDELRLETTGALASAIAAIPEVRAALKERQRAFRELPGLVADAPARAHLPHGQVTHVIATSDLPFSDRFVFRIYVEAPNGSDYVVANFDGHPVDR